MPDRSRDWLNQAVRDLEQAEDSRKAGRHEWACFAAQQAAEMFLFIQKMNGNLSGSRGAFIQQSHRRLFGFMSEKT